MAFTNTNLSTTSLLETTFISDMRIIVNSNITVLQSKIEDIINNLQIDLVNKYIGVDLPLGQLYTHNLIVSNQMLYKAGTGGSAATIASLTQSSGYSTFTSNDLLFTRTLKATATNSRAAIRTVVVGGTSGSSDLSYPTTSGNAVPGLYVGDSTHPVSAGFYGEVNVANQAITQSYIYSREIGVTRVGSTYSYGNLVLSKTDPQFIFVNIKLSDTGVQASDKPIWLQLHEDYTTDSTRPNLRQSFTIVINQILDSADAPIAVTDWPEVKATTSEDGSLSIMPGYIKSSTSGTGCYKIGYINSAMWASGSFPTSGTSAIGYVPSSMEVKTFVRLFNPDQQTSSSLPNERGASLTITKIEETTDYSNYVVTGGSNFVVVNS